jgi:hypothetical protein
MMIRRGMVFLRLFFLVLCVNFCVTVSHAQSLFPFPPISDISPNSRGQTRLSVEERIVLIKTTLAFTPSQSKYWPDIEVALLDYYAIRTTQRQEIQEDSNKRREAQIPLDPVVRLQMTARHQRENADKTENLARKLSYLYPLLDNAQKKRITALLPRQNEPRSNLSRME